MNIKDIILGILDFLRYQVENDKCTASELESVYKSVANGISIDATVKDIAAFHGQNESNVRNVVQRTHFPKDKAPKRKVFYNYGWLASRLPHKWFKQ